MIMKGSSVCLLDLIVGYQRMQVLCQNLQLLCGDIGNTCIQAYTKEKFYIRCGPGFGEHQHSIAVIVQARYGLTPSAEKFSAVLVNSLPVIGFKPNRFDRNVWTRMCDSRDGYAYICTHADVFMVVAMGQTMWIVAKRLSSS